MDYLKIISNTLESTAFIALASASHNEPDIRLVVSHYDPEQKGILYFITIKDSPKTIEFAHNNKVAFTTIPAGPGAVIRSRKAVIRKSSLSVENVKHGIMKKYPAMDTSRESTYEVYEIHFNNVLLSIESGEIEVAL